MREKIDSALEASSGIDATENADEGERLVIIRAMAVGFSVFRWVCSGAALVFMASGLWFAAILVMAVSDLPRWAAAFYAKNRGVDFFQQSGVLRSSTTISGLIGALLSMIILIGLVLYHSITGHPLINWTWSIPDLDRDLAEALVLGFGVAAVVVVLMWFRRRRHRRRFGTYSLF